MSQSRQEAEGEPEVRETSEKDLNEPRVLRTLGEDCQQQGCQCKGPGAAVAGMCLRRAGRPMVGEQ
jgi:hypothetical protein